MTATVVLTERTVGGLHAYLASVLQAEGIGSNARVLDIGCGTGAFLSRLDSLGYTDLHGIDQDLPQPLAGIAIRRYDLNRDDPADLGQYDLVTCIEVIEHIENIGRLLDCLQAVLRPGGLAVITTPNVESLIARLRSVLVGELPHFDDRSDPTHLVPILRKGLARMLDRRALRIERSAGYPAEPRASLAYSRGMIALRRLLGPLFGDPLPGDVAVHLIRHA